jgi:hypothetical protein
VIWSSFLAASVGTMFCFALIDPVEASAGFAIDGAPIGRTALYTLGFAFFWAMSAVASALSAWLLENPRTPR